MTNLKTNEEVREDCSDSFGCRSSMNIRTREKPLFPTPIYSLKMSQNLKRHKILTVGFVWSNGPHRLAPKKTPRKCTSHHPLRRCFQSLHPSLHHRSNPNSQTFRLYQLSSLGASVPVRPDDSVSRPTLGPVNNLTMETGSHDVTWPTALATSQGLTKSAGSIHNKELFNATLNMDQPPNPAYQWIKVI